MPLLKKVIFISFMFLFSVTGGICQYTIDGGLSTAIKKKRVYQDTVWTVAGDRILDSKYRKWKVDFVLDARQTLVGDKRARLAGLRLGMEFRRVHRFGCGFYNMGAGVWVTDIASINPEIDSALLKFSYLSVFYERVLFFNKRFEWSATANTGMALISGEYTNPKTEEHIRFERSVRPVEVSTTCYYNLTYFISIGAGVGYRYVPDAPEEVQSIYSSPLAILRIRIKLLKMVRGFYNPEVRQTY